MAFSIHHCTLCPRMCGADRTVSSGLCGGKSQIHAARAALHLWEEPCISGKKGTGAVFFSGCSLHCCYCQNHKISQEGFGTAISVSQLSEILLRLQKEGAESIDLVTGSSYIPWIVQSLEQVRSQLSIPIVWNSSGYESIEALQMLEGYIDVYLPDWKYNDAKTASQYSDAANYVTVTEQAIHEMLRQVGYPVWKDGVLQKGVLIRHLILPGHRHESIALLQKIASIFPKDAVLLSLMGQYTPPAKLLPYQNLNRRLTTMEYQSVLRHAQELDFSGFSQELSSAQQSYTPSFQLEGLSFS